MVLKEFLQSSSRAGSPARLCLYSDIFFIKKPFSLEHASLEVTGGHEENLNSLPYFSCLLVAFTKLIFHQALTASQVPSYYPHLFFKVLSWLQLFFPVACIAFARPFTLGSSARAFSASLIFALLMLPVLPVLFFFGCLDFYRGINDLSFYCSLPLPKVNEKQMPIFFRSFKKKSLIRQVLTNHSFRLFIILNNNVIIVFIIITIAAFGNLNSLSASGLAVLDLVI